MYNFIYACKKTIKSKKIRCHFNEKIQWLKLYDRKEIYHTIVDKCEVKKYVSQKIGEEYIIPTIGIWKSTNSIDINTLPASFVIKATHDSGGVYICKDKSNFNFDDCYRNLERTLKHDFYLNSREWAYKGVESRIIAEKFLDDNDLKDYKIFFVLMVSVKYLKLILIEILSMVLTITELMEIYYLLEKKYVHQILIKKLIFQIILAR